ncbi:hypothetical protein ACFWY5_14840 [Nonomuraea sp. NPDC059007]|uniref:hypothetical protein n=1 Tax=Nonomuraea sp. NPDC059007 TaxID=3346692 RepID=UPI0036888A2F
MCGDDQRALRVVGDLVRDAGGVPAVLGPLDRARQLEEVAGFVIGLAVAGTDPGSAIPRLPTSSHHPGRKPFTRREVLSPCVDLYADVAPDPS